MAKRDGPRVIGIMTPPMLEPGSPPLGSAPDNAAFATKRWKAAGGGHRTAAAAPPKSVGSRVRGDLRPPLVSAASDRTTPARPRTRAHKRLRLLPLAGALGLVVVPVQFGSTGGVTASEVATVGNLPPGQAPLSDGGAAAAFLRADLKTPDLKTPELKTMAARLPALAALWPATSSATDRPAVPAGTGEVTEHGGRAAAATAAPRARTADAGLEVGEKFKIVFYEHVDDVEKNKWGRASSALQGFQLRPELSGDYVVQGDGTISLPLLGSFAAVDRSPRVVEKALANAFEKLTGRKGFVTILPLARPPVYVLGPVKNPGSYKFVPGMTVLHTIALAGGFDRRTTEPWQQVEAVREVEKRRAAIEGMARTLARAAVLRSERDGSNVVMPQRLQRLVGDEDAKQLVADEIDRRAPIVAARRGRERAVAASLSAARQEVQMLSHRLGPIDGLIKLRQKRAAAMAALLRRGMINNLVMVQAQSELSDAEQRRQDAVNQLAMAKQRVALAREEQAKLDADTKGDIENAILVADRQVKANERETLTSEGVLGALRVTAVSYASPSGTPSYAYEVVRQQGASGPVAMPATGMTVLQPGDLVRVVRGDMQDATDPAPYPGTPSSAALRQQANGTPDRHQ